MKRDLDLIRDILLHVEDVTSFSEHIFGYDLGLETSKSSDEIYGHVALLFDEDLIFGNLDETMGDGVGHLNIERLTNKGHDYLNFIRNPKIWSDTKAGLAKAGGTASLAIVQATAVAIFKTSLGKVGIDI